MPSNISTFETGFPMFTGEETPQQQILALHNYLYQLREGLVYSLRNLTKENFNTTALQNMTDAQKSEITALMTQAKSVVSELSVRVDNIIGRVTGAEKRITSAESEIDRIGKSVADNENDIKSLQTAVSENEEAMGILADRVQETEDELSLLEEMAADLTNLEDQVAGHEESIQQLAGAVGVAEDGSITIGVPGQVIRLVGTIYINGVLYEQGETT